MEINNNSLVMGIGNIIGDRRKSASLSTSSCIQKVQRTIKKETQKAEDKDYSSIKCIVAALQTVPNMDDEIFLEVCELLEDERKATMLVAMDVTVRRKWLLKKLQR
ncbi:hypothetical protein CFP56_012744 [Quercus suber]|uniref:At2g29880-like C-terminal domain-containing protein n=1 Tax=Quercus suber TaxID=58331 RepID=A0AAW0KUZ7_QUESU